MKTFDEFNPHATLGLHSFKNDKRITLWRPGAKEITLLVQGKIVNAKRIGELGLFESVVDSEISSSDYLVYDSLGHLIQDPYSFPPSIGEIDLYLFSQGVHYQLYEVLGARLIKFQEIEGVRFTLFAPNAKSVSVVGDFNFWDGRLHPMRLLGSSGVWELFIPGIKEGAKYKFEIRTANKELKIKADPMAYSSEQRPLNASIVANVDKFIWKDQEFLKKRVKPINKPMNIYEVHLGSWKKQDGWKFYNYKEIAVELVAYCKSMHYTHIELLPVKEHPLDESWGYQVSGYYATTSRFGTPEDFQWFVNYFHEHGLGVILDWVPGHFPTDDFSLGRFDGTALYEHEHEWQGFHPHWYTYIFNFGRKEISNFLIASALFFFEKMHIDGLRVDAVASMLYLNYGRENDAFIPNKHGGIENLEAIEFLKHLNSIVNQKHPSVLMIAEDSSSFLGVTKSVAEGGLGFDFKWNMGWMNDTLRYFAKDPIHRKFHHNDLTFGLIYAFSEHFILVLSHDEVANGKQSLISKMPGDEWQQFANVRLLISYMICQPGKKLLFMGCEIGQWNEWSCTGQIEWFLTEFATHRGLQQMVRDINYLYVKEEAFWKHEDHKGFEWIDYNDTNNSVVSYLRKSDDKVLLCVHNFTPNCYPEYFVKLPKVKTVQEIFNSDEGKYSGSNKCTQQATIIGSDGLIIQLAPLATMIFRINDELRDL